MSRGRKRAKQANASSNNDAERGGGGGDEDGDEDAKGEDPPRCHASPFRELASPLRCHSLTMMKRNAAMTMSEHNGSSIGIRRDRSKW